MNQLNIALATVGTVVLVLGLLSRPLNRSIFSIPLLAFAAGIVLGPVGLNVLNPTQWGDQYKILEEAARLTLGFSLMAIAMRVPRRYPLKHWKSFAVLLGLGMPLMFAASSLLAYWTLGLPVLAAMLVGASICPTDPVVGSSVVTGGLAQDKLPGRFRHTLSVESGANDGLAYPLVLLPVLLLTQTSGGVWTEWAVRVLLWEVGGAIVLGAALGWVVAWALRYAEAKNTVDYPSFLATTLALTVLALGLGKVFGTDSILAVFAAGLVFDGYAAKTAGASEENVQEAANLFFTLPVFLLFGLMLPVDLWLELGWAGAALAVLILLFRRLPVIFLLRPIIPRWRDYPMALVGGWFGPIGISALFYAMLVLTHTGNDIAWAAGSLVVAASLVAHGVTAAPVAKLYGRRYPHDQQE